MCIEIVDNDKKKYRIYKNATLTFPNLKDGSSLIKVEKRLLSIGGWNIYTLKTDNNIWSLEEGKKWEKLESGSFDGRHCFGTIKFKNKYWIIGGDGNKGKYQNDVWSSIDGLKWTLVSKNNAFLEKMFHTVFTFNDKIWVVGGENISELVTNKGDKVFNEIWNSVDGKIWNKVDLKENSFPARAEIICNTNFTKKAWIIGGWKYHDYYLNDVWSSIDGLNWKQHSSPPFDEITFHNLQEFDGKIWVIGGISNLENTNEIWFTSDGENWFKINSSDLIPSHALSTLVDLNQLYIFGGGHKNFYSIKYSKCAE